MTSHYKTGGVWKTTTPYVKVAGNWKIPKSAWRKLDAKWKSWFLQGGVNDADFNTEDTVGGADSTIEDIVVQSDGKLVLIGQFTTFAGVIVNGIARVNLDGTLDTDFAANTGTGAIQSHYGVAIQSDGKILIGGAFTVFNGATVNYIVRLNSDGTRDTAFTTNTGTAFNGVVYSIAVQSDGKILVGGTFTTFNGATVNSIVRLNSSGTRDTAFTTNNGTGFNGRPIQIVIQSDGKILLGGSFTTFNGATVNYIVRLNSDGTRDTAFTTNNGTGCNNSVETIAIQSDGKILVGGSFTTFNGATVNYIVRLNSDGTRDTAFTTNTGTGANGTVLCICIQSDGKIVIGGSFPTFNDATVNRIVRLNPDGTRDTAFTTNTGAGMTIAPTTIIELNGLIVAGFFQTFNNTRTDRIVRLNLDGTVDTSILIPTGFLSQLNAHAIQSDGKILVVGTFATFDGVTVNRIVRLNSDGTRDTAFTTNTGTAASGSVLSVSIQSDGKILIGGLFSTFDGATVNNIVRLNSDGTRDTAFTTNNGTATNGTIRAIATQSDGKILIGGDFSTFNGVTVNRIVRLNSDGTRDTAFTTNTGTGSSSAVRVLTIQSDGKILIGGDCITFNGATVNNIVRLNSDGTRDTAFTTNTGTAFNVTTRAIHIQSDGKIVIGGEFATFNGVTVNRIVRLNSDGTRDTPFTTNTGTGFTALVERFAVQLDGKIVACGDFRGFNNRVRNYICRIGGDVAQ